LEVKSETVVDFVREKHWRLAAGSGFIYLQVVWVFLKFVFCRVIPPAGPLL